MKNKFIKVMVAILLLYGGVVFADTPIEPDAIISPEFQNHKGAMEDAVLLVRTRGWRCDSISGFASMTFSRGFHLYCNKYSYEYDIEDKGGKWTATLK
jgi:hypothetical protein